jgi:hypothetical protein
MVIASLASDGSWRDLIGASGPARRLIRAEAISGPDAIDDGDPRILVTDLADVPAGAEDESRTLRAFGPCRTIIWAGFSNGLVDRVVKILACGPADILWSDRGRELTRLRHLLAFEELPGACARLGHALAADLKQLPPELQSSFLQLFGNSRQTVRPGDLTRRIPPSQGNSRVSRRRVGRLIRLVGHARGWDSLQAGASVATAAEAALFGPTRAYSDAFKLLIGGTPTEATETLSTPEFVERLLASVPPIE